MTSLTIFAPAKINLYLHVTGRLDNGYHTLDSLISFADIGDEILIEKADDFSFRITGPYASSFPDDACKSNHDSTNLVVRAVFALSQKLEKLPNFTITLTKNLPIASGIGGGSSNAAAVLWGLIEWWGIQADQTDFLPELFLELGADVPVCYFSQPARVTGIGQYVDPVHTMPEMDIVLVNPGIPCHTATVFAKHTKSFSQKITLPETLGSLDHCLTFLEKQGNDLTDAACEIVPEIKAVLDVLGQQDGCLLSRLSGSGATCFAIFDNASAAQKAAQTIAHHQPNWWVSSGSLNRIERY